MTQKWREDITEEELITIQNSISKVSEREFLEQSIAEEIAFFLREGRNPIFVDLLLKEHNEEWDTTYTPQVFGMILKKMGFVTERRYFDGKKRTFIASLRDE